MVLVKPNEKSRGLLPFVNGSFVNFNKISCWLNLLEFCLLLKV